MVQDTTQLKKYDPPPGRKIARAWQDLYSIGVHNNEALPAAQDHYGHRAIEYFLELSNTDKATATNGPTTVTSSHDNPEGIHNM